MPRFKTWRSGVAALVCEPFEPLGGEVSRMEANMSCGDARIRVRFLLLLERQGGSLHVPMTTRSHLVRRLGGHYSATRALIADWLQRDEFRADFSI